MRDRSRHAHGPGPGRVAPARRQPADRRRAHGGPSLADRHRAPRRSPAGPSLRDVATPLPAPAPLPVGAAPGAGRRGAAAARRVRRRRPGPRVPLAAPAERAPTRLRRLVVLALHRHLDHRRPPPDRLGRRGRPHVPRHLARARRRRPARAVGRRRVGNPPHRPQPAPDRRRGRARRDPRRRRGRRVGRRRRRSAGARAHPPRRRLLRLPGRHLGGGARAPGPAGAATHVPAPPAGGDARDRDRRRPPRPPAAGRGRSPPGDHGRAIGHGRRRHQGPLQGGRGARRAGRVVAERRVVAARARGGGRPHQRAAHPPPGRRLPLRGRRHRPALLGDRTAAGPPAPHCAVPPGHRGPGRRGSGGHRRHRHDHAVARHSARAATFVDRGRRAPRARRWRCTSSTPPTSSPWSSVPLC